LAGPVAASAWPPRLPGPAPRWHLQRTVTVIFKSWGDPVVLLSVRGGEQVTIMARYENRHGYYTWGRTKRVEIGPDAARSIAAAVVA
jgi:hypothetical protein